MLHFKIYKTTITFLMLLVVITITNAQTARVKPVWWFGESVAANFNFFRGTTQTVNSNLTVPAAFHKGTSVKPYASLLVEYRPDNFFGLMLNVAYDNRGGKFDNAMAPCDCPATLTTNLSYITVEPSVRIAPFSSSFYVFAGPTIGFNISKSFTYTQEKQSDVTGDLSDVRKTLFGAQAGLGVDIPVSKKTSEVQMTISPFASFQTDILQTPRTIENLSIYTIRAGVALKFGIGDRINIATPPTPPTVINTTPQAPPVNYNNSVQFTVRAPKVSQPPRQVKETFPLRNSVFFEKNSTAIPARYITLSQTDAVTFTEEQLYQSPPADANAARSSRQLEVHHNILNIIGYRMKTNTQSTIKLTGSAYKNPAEGKKLAESVKAYWVNNFGIDASRITTEGRSKPVIPSEQSGSTNDLTLVREEDRRVDISSTSPELLMQLGGDPSAFFRPINISSVQEDPIDNYITFNADGADTAFKSWAIDITDEQGNIQHYGPFTGNMASVSSKTILGNSEKGTYKVTMVGQTNTGETISKESSINLMKAPDKQQTGMRYSILFDFDKSTPIDIYEKFITNEIAPLIPDNARIVIHGHTDIVGEEKHNLNLSNERAMSAQKIIEAALAKYGKTGVKFETYGFGEDATLSPFANGLPEERFYNRTVIIDIISSK